MGIRDTIIERSKKALMSSRSNASRLRRSRDEGRAGRHGREDAGSRRLASPAQRARSSEHRSGARRAPRQGRGRRAPSTAAPAKKNGSNGAHGSNGSNGSERRPRGSGFFGHGRVDAERTSLASIGGKDIFEKCRKFMAADNARKMGIYPFFRPLDLADGPEAVINDRRVTMFGSNNYLGLTTHPKVREAAKAAIDRFGTEHDRLAPGERLDEAPRGVRAQARAQWFGKESALVFTTGYQVNLAPCSRRCSRTSRASR